MRFSGSLPKYWFRRKCFFRRCAAAGQKNGTTSTSQAAEDLARLLLSTLLGIRVLARTRPEHELLEGSIRPVFALLDSPPLKNDRDHTMPLSAYLARGGRP